MRMRAIARGRGVAGEDEDEGGSKVHGRHSLRVFGLGYNTFLLGWEFGLPNPGNPAISRFEIHANCLLCFLLLPGSVHIHLSIFVIGITSCFP